MLKKSHVLLFCLLLFAAFAFPAAARCETLPAGFVYVDEVVPGIQVELRYYSDYNFVGKRVDGYVAPRCILTREATEALKGVQKDLNVFGLGLKVYDGYRPQRSVDHFVRWGKDPGDTRMKKDFYPNVEKSQVFKEGYIAEKSGHSRGSTVDLTIVALGAKASDQGLDMGTAFDYFGQQSWPDNAEVGADARAHRMLLKLVMEKHGFKPYDKEWWHFTLKNEPYPETYFDFPVQ
jgi:D-alanyl-D-alanine dipeptidase